MPRPDPSSRRLAPRRRPVTPPAGAAAALLTLLAFAVAGAGGGTVAQAQELGPLTRVSGGRSPFADCAADRAGRQEGELFRATEIEPFVAADPRNPNNLLVGHQQDRWSNGGARGTVARVSTNGGASWRAVAIPDVSRCSGREFLRASDPWVDFSPSGVAYYMSLAIDPFPTDPDDPTAFIGFGRNAMLVNRSTNGGRGWGDPVTLIETDDPRFLNDKNSLTADPTNPNFAYAVWDRLEDFSLPPELRGGGAPGARARAKFLRERAESGREALAEIFFKGP
ncbi:MAG TPA: hypothetical protein VF606_07450, partial [Geminicoccaceae bacterium]